MHSTFLDLMAFDPRKLFPSRREQPAVVIVLFTTLALAKSDSREVTPKEQTDTLFLYIRNLKPTTAMNYSGQPGVGERGNQTILHPILHTSCVAVAPFKAANMANVLATQIKNGVTIAGVVGDYPRGTNPLAGADATADLALATFDGKIKAATNFEWFNISGTRYVNSGDADIVDTHILNTANIFGTHVEKLKKLG